MELSYHEVERLIASLDEITESLTQHLANLENEASIRPLMPSGPFCIKFWRGPLLTHCIMLDSSTVTCWTSPFVILGVSGQFCRFYSIFDGKSFSKQC